MPESAETSLTPSPKKNQRGSSSFYQIDIPETEYKKLSENSRKKLESLGIYPEMEVPEFDEVSVLAPKNPRRKTHVEKLFMKYVLPCLCALYVYYVLGS